MPSLKRPLHLTPLAAVIGLLVAAAVTRAADTSASAPAPAASSPDDPYLWLEDVDGAKAMDWVRAENQKTLSVLEKDDRFAKFNEEALAIAQAKDRIPNPSQLDGRIFNFWQDADHVRGLWRSTTTKDYDAGGDPAWTPVLDLDKLASDEKANWVWKGAGCEPTREQHCLLSLSDGGEDAITVREFDITKAAFVKDRGFSLPKGKQTFAWQSPDSILVSREWNKGELTASGYPYIVKQVKRGQPLAQAREIFRGEPNDGGYGVTPLSLFDAKGHHALLIDRPLTTFETEHYIVTPAGPKKLEMPGKTNILELYDGQILVRVAEDWHVGSTTVPAGALAALVLKEVATHPESLHPTIVYEPGPRQSLDSVAGTKAGLLVTSLDNVRGRAALYVRHEDGQWTSTPLAMPDNATLGIVDSDPHTTTAYLSAASYLLPSSLWRVDATGPAHPPRKIRSTTPKFDASRDEVEQFEATSTDGTKIPYFVVHPKDMKTDGENPTILYAYGGFEVSITPSYAPITGKLWLEHGGVYVVANIRGGGEFGPAWHEAGLKTRRQTIYDDFASVGRDLVARKITSPRRLGIEGGSNGGLLMGVEMTEHPELWNAVDIQVPLLDMIRYEHIAAGTSWVGEYGSMSVPEERAFWEKTSPYQNLRRGVKYPRALVWTTTKDDRVGPQHARKFAARLGEYGIPYYYYEVIEGGHGSGANLKERAHTSAIEYTYFARQLMDQ